MTAQLERLSPVRHAIITLGVILGMLMQLLDMTIANVALPHIQASLGATQDTIDWVLTAYIVAVAIAFPSHNSRTKAATLDQLSTVEGFSMM